MNEVVERSVKAAEEQLDGGNYKKALARLDDALWNVRVVDALEDFDRIEALAVRAAEESEGRVSEKARSLAEQCDARRTYMMTSRAVRIDLDRKPRPDAHKRRRSLAWCLKVAGLLPIAIFGLGVGFAAATDSTANGGSTILFLVVVLLIAALGLAAWRRPGLVGGLSLAFVPFGLFGAVLGSTNLDPTSQVIGLIVFLAGLPFVAGVLLVLAGRLRR